MYAELFAKVRHDLLKSQWNENHSLENVMQLMITLRSVHFIACNNLNHFKIIL